MPSIVDPWDDRVCWGATSLQEVPVREEGDDGAAKASSRGEQSAGEDISRSSPLKARRAGHGNLGARQVGGSDHRGTVGPPSDSGDLAGSCDYILVGPTIAGSVHALAKFHSRH